MARGLAGTKGLLVWVAVSCLLFVLAPDPPPTPVVDDDEQAVWHRTALRAAEDAKRWQQERGDFVVPWEQAAGRLVIVIDDVGRELHLFERLLALRWRLTFSILPGAVYAPGAQLRLVADGRRHREILLHLPMEPLAADEMSRGLEADEEFLLVSDDDETLRAKTERALTRIPTAVGVNNHMGSRLTGDARAMTVVARVLRERGLYFLDSRTSATSIAEPVVAGEGVPAVVRHVFLDHDPRREAIAIALADAVVRSRSAPVVVIGHPSRALVAVLERALPVLHRAGVGVYPLSEVVAHLQARKPATGTTQPPIDSSDP